MTVISKGIAPYQCPASSIRLHITVSLESVCLRSIKRINPINTRVWSRILPKEGLAWMFYYWVQVWTRVQRNGLTYWVIKFWKKWITSVSIIKTWFCKDFVIEDQFSVPNSSSSFYSLTCSSIWQFNDISDKYCSFFKFLLFANFIATSWSQSFKTM